VDFQSTKDDIVDNPSSPTAVPLPKQYNISYVEVLIRDPLWAFVFWEIKGHDREVHENAQDFNGYCLHVIPVNERESEQQLKEKSFTVQVTAQDSARYIGFAAPEMEHSVKESSRYIIKLNVIRGDSEINITASHVFDLPRLYEKEDLVELSDNALLRLSGVQDLSITKKTDRQSRSKR
jgi:hypothetical protein